MQDKKIISAKQVETDEADMRLDRWFKLHYPALSFGNLQKLLRSGQIRVDGRRAKSDNRIKAGQLIRIPPIGEFLPADEGDKRPLTSRTLRDQDDDTVLRQMLPATLGVSVAQISLLINTNIATWLTPGSVTWLSFADRLMEFPTALLGVALGTVLLPSLSRAHAQGDGDTYNRLLDHGLRLVLLLGLPAAFGLALLADGLVATLFHYGAFQATDVARTQLAVIAYSVGLLGLLSVKILAPGFYAKQDIRTPVKIAIGVLIATQCLNLVLVPQLHHAGLALAIGMGACCNALALLMGLRRRGIYRPCARDWSRLLLRLLPALTAMAVPLLLADRYIDWIALQPWPLLRAGWLAATVVSAAGLYFGVLRLSGFRYADFRRAVP